MNKPMSKNCLREFTEVYGENTIANPTIHDALEYLREAHGVYIWATPMKWNPMREMRGHCGGIQWLRRETPYHAISSKIITYPRGGAGASYTEAIEYTIIWYFHNVLNKK